MKWKKLFASIFSRPAACQPCETVAQVQAQMEATVFPLVIPQLGEDVFYIHPGTVALTRDLFAAKNLIDAAAYCITHRVRKKDGSRAFSLEDVRAIFEALGYDQMERILEQINHKPATAELMGESFAAIPS